MINNFIRAVFSILGYSIIKKSEKKVNYSLFENLALGYEMILNEYKQIKLSSNERRHQLLADARGTLPAEAFYIIESLHKTNGFEGDVCEFGVAQGITSALIANEIIIGKKLLHLFDSFEGLPKPTENDELKDDVLKLGCIGAYKSKMSFPENMVKKRLLDVGLAPERYIIHKGFIENVLKTDNKLPTKVSFAYVDFDFYEPIKVTLEFLDKVSVNGAIIIIDDYDFFSTGVKKAVDEFIISKNKISKRYDLLIPDKNYGCFSILYKVN